MPCPADYDTLAVLKPPVKLLKITSIIINFYIYHHKLITSIIINFEFLAMILVKCFCNLGMLESNERGEPSNQTQSRSMSPILPRHVKGTPRSFKSSTSSTTMRLGPEKFRKISLHSFSAEFHQKIIVRSFLAFEPNSIAHF